MSTSNKDNSLKKARNLGQLNGTKVFNDFVSKDDRIDFRKFRLTQRSSLSFSVSKLESAVDIQVLNKNGAALAQLRPSGKQGQAVLDNLDSDVYYIRIKRRRGETKYRLKLVATPVSPPTPPSNFPSATDDNTPLTSRNLGTLGSGTLSYSDYVGDLDEIDYYKFNLATVSDFNANVSGVTGGTYIYLYRDANNNGQIDSGEQINYEYAGNTGNISKILTPGNYFFAVEKYDSTEYSLTLTTTSYPDYTPTTEPGDQTVTARQIGTGSFSGTFTAKDYIGSLDTTDYYKFSLNAVSDFNANLSGITGGAYMYLYRDNNNNGQIDSGEQINYAYAGNTNNISQILTPGNYFFAVQEYYSTRYDLILTTVPYSTYTPATDPGELTSTALNLGTFTGSRSLKDYVGDLDGTDFYRFSLSQTRSFNANLAGVTGGSYMYLYRDTNGNGQIDNGEQINYAYAGNTGTISATLTAGTYFFEVREYNSTRYDLNFQIT